MVILKVLETQFTTAIVSNVYLAISRSKLLWNTRWCAYFFIINIPQEGGGAWGRETFLILWLVGLCLARHGCRWCLWEDESIACMTVFTHSYTMCVRYS